MVAQKDEWLEVNHTSFKILYKFYIFLWFMAMYLSCQATFVQLLIFQNFSQEKRRGASPRNDTYSMETWKINV